MAEFAKEGRLLADPHTDVGTVDAMIAAIVDLEAAGEMDASAFLVRSPAINEVAQNVKRIDRIAFFG